MVFGGAYFLLLATLKWDAILNPFFPLSEYSIAHNPAVVKRFFYFF